MQDWSPEQISGWLRQSYPDDETLRVSHETIYRTLFLQARGALKQELVPHLRSKRRIRRSRHASVHGHSQGRIIDAISIRERRAGQCCFYPLRPPLLTGIWPFPSRWNEIRL
jgi:IS30 family transposase